MALVPCPECQHEVSSLALACPQCAYPYPGKQGETEEKLQSCGECGGVVSKKAQLCPHCGVSSTNTSENKQVREEYKDESWLCTHCGTPYTRKVRKIATHTSHAENQPSDNQKPSVTKEQEVQQPVAHISNVDNQQSDDQQPPVTARQEIRKPAVRDSNARNQPSDNPKPPVTEEQEISFLQKMGAAAAAPAATAGRHPSPLWFPSSPAQDLGSSPSRPRKKGMIIVGIVLVMLIALSIMVWVLWEPNGTNLFDVLAIPAWSMNHSLPTTPQGGP